MANGIWKWGMTPSVSTLLLDTVLSPNKGQVTYSSIKELRKEEAMNLHPLQIIQREIAGINRW